MHKKKTIQIWVYSFKHKRTLTDVYPDSDGKKRFFLIDAVILSITFTCSSYVIPCRQTLYKQLSNSILIYINLSLLLSLFTTVVVVELH